MQKYTQASFYIEDYLNGRVVGFEPTRIGSTPISSATGAKGNKIAHAQKPGGIILVRMRWYHTVNHNKKSDKWLADLKANMYLVCRWGIIKQ